MLRQAVPPAALLERIEAQLAVTETVHQFKPARPAGAASWCDDCAEGASSDGNPTDSSLSAGWARIGINPIFCHNL
jgi:hypothetical protein